MMRMSLPPGFRFHPTDVELILYYLKRKVMGKKLHCEAIAEVNIYKFSPWDLPDKSCLKSKDLEWFFFCPREKKYASGVRVKRATENGYWKTTGKDRAIRCNEKTIGSVRTLVFHLGHAPQGERTDWVIHEYMILDDELAETGVQDTYVLCKVFKKNGPGPKNGAQYGAPFNEADWPDDDVGDAQHHATSLTYDGPSPTTVMQPKEKISLVGGLTGTKKTSGSLFLEGGLSPSAGGPTSEVVADDEFERLLASFADEETLLFKENGSNQDDLSGKGKIESLPCPDGHDIFNGLGDLDSWAGMNGGRHDFSGSWNDDYFLNNTLPLDNSNYIELDDFQTPLDCSNGVGGTNRSSLCEILGSFSRGNMQQFSSGSIFPGMELYSSCANELLPVPPEGSFEGDNCLDVLQMIDHQIHQGTNASYDLEFTFGQPENGIDPTHMERGSHIKKCYSRWLPSATEHLSLSFCSTSGGSSIHIKAEVTHGAGECTNEALSVMMGGSGRWCCNLPFWSVFQKMQLWVVNRLMLLLLVEIGFCLSLVYQYLNDSQSWSSYYYHPIQNSLIVFSSITISG